jgi:hypothetical protein
MHDLQDFANSVRSFRASIYGSNSVRKEPSTVDLEKGQDDAAEKDYGDKDFDRVLSPDSSVILVLQRRPTTRAVQRF